MTWGWVLLIIGVVILLSIIASILEFKEKTRQQLNHEPPKPVKDEGSALQQEIPQRESAVEKPSALLASAIYEKHGQRGFSPCYPADKTKSNFENLFVFEVEGKEITIERSKDGLISVFQSKKKIMEIGKNESTTLNELEVAGHRLTLQYKEESNLLFLLFWNYGFRIAIDGVPVERSVDDPQRKLKFAAAAFFVLAGIMVFTALRSKDPDANLAAVVIVPILIAFGLLTKKAPIFITAMGVLLGVSLVGDHCFRVVKALEPGHGRPNTFWILLGLSLKLGVAWALVQGLLAGFRLRSLKKSLIEKSKDA